jgi:hypothetical protein
MHITRHIKLTVLVGLCASFVIALPVRALAEWATVGNWSIETNDGGCYLIAGYEGGTYFAIGLDGASKSDMLMPILIYNQKWRSIQVGASYEVGVDFDRGTDWIVDFTGVATDSVKGLLNEDHAYAEDSGIFAEDFMRSDYVYVEFEGERVAYLNLSGSRAAYEEMVDCHKSFIGSGATEDPFSDSDPFR